MNLLSKEETNRWEAYISLRLNGGRVGWLAAGGEWSGVRGKRRVLVLGSSQGKLCEERQYWRTVLVL